MSDGRPNIALRANIMLDDAEHLPEKRYLPGDLVALVYPELCDVRRIERALTRRQRQECELILVCVLCRKPCAGTCER